MFRTFTLAVALTACLAAVGCGGDDGGTTAATSATPAASAQAVTVAALPERYDEVSDAWADEETTATPWGGRSVRQRIADELIEDERLIGATRAEIRALFGEPMTVEGEDHLSVGFTEEPGDRLCHQSLVVSYRDGRATAARYERGACMSRSEFVAGAGGR